MLRSAIDILVLILKKSYTILTELHRKMGASLEPTQRTPIAQSCTDDDDDDD